MVVPVLGAVISFVIALLVGGLAIYLSARFFVDVDDYRHAIGTAVVGAIGWALTSWIPLFGPIIALLVWVGVINWRYPGGWVTAGSIGLGAWAAALLILGVVNLVFGLGIGAFGIPGM